MRPYRTALAEQMREKLTTLPARALYGRRKQIVEPVIGQIKAGRGFRRMSFRDRAKAAAAQLVQDSLFPRIVS